MNSQLQPEPLKSEPGTADPKTSGRLLSVNVGTIETISSEKRTVNTGIWKRPVTSRVKVRGINIEGDDQADRLNHGGRDKAVYAYAIEDYEWFAAQENRVFQPGDFGENLTTIGVDVTKALIGERWFIGSVEFEVSEPRLPCFKLGMKMNDHRFPARFAKALRPGAYLRIVREGEIGTSDAIQILFQPDHGVSIRDVADAYLFNHELLKRLVDVPQLRPIWYRRARGE
jgi:MOSC domain-containing protein YiiM